MAEEPQFDRSELVDLLGVKLKIETPEEREESIRFKVDQKLVKLFGVNIALSTTSRNFSIDQIAKILESHRIDIDPEVFIKDSFKAFPNPTKNYYFQEVLTPGSDVRYQLRTRYYD